MRLFSPALAILLSVSLLDARQEKLSCGSHPDRWREEIQLHRDSLKSGVKRLRKANTARVAGEKEIGGVSVRPDAGNIAILDDTGGVVARRNPFNLGWRTLRFLPVSADTRKYRFELAADTYDVASASAGSAISGLGDDDSREVPLPFPFPFFGAKYDSAFVNSDGNLTFTSGDVAVTDRSLGRFISGAPRIAPLFRDLDPSRSGSVRTLADGDRFVISWVQVPEYRDSGTGPTQTFQVRLFADGRIEIAWSDISTQEAVVGITPGRLQGSASILSFSTATSGEYSSALAERFSGNESIDIFSSAQKFFLNHEDSYDYLVIFNNLNIEADDSAVAYEVTVRNNRSGYGDEKVDIGVETASTRRLQAILNMGPLSQYPSDPASRVPARFTVGDTPVTTIAHETGHLFLAFASVRNDNDPSARPMLGYQSAHWNFLFNSEASLLEGNRIQDNGPAASPRFQTTGTVEGYAPLDQYLMGFRAAEEVPDTFLVTNAKGSRISGLPRTGVSFDGDRRDIRIDEIIRVEGRRTPDYTVAQRRFRFAFLLVTEAGKEPTADELAQVESYRAAFEQFYSKASSERAVADATLKRSLRVSTWPAAGVTVGASASGTVAIESPAQTPLTVFLRPQNGNIETPGSVTIAAGATEAGFQMTGRREGTVELIAEPADAQYETVYSRVQVAPSDSLRLVVSGGNFQTARPGTPLSQPIQVRVTDINELPYPGVAVSASVSAGGVIDRTSAMSDENGIASFRWTPGAGSENELRATISGGAAVVATALGRPALADNGVVNAASFAPGLTPGGIATVFGTNLAGTGPATVLLNGQSTQVFYSSARQVNFYVPPGTGEGMAEIVVRNGIGSSTPVQVRVMAVQPGVFFDAASGYGAVLTAGTGQVTQVRPVSRGETIEIYTTGLGEVVTQTNGQRWTAAATQVLIAGSPAEVTYSGVAPGFTGLYQINARVPAGIPSGAQTLIVVSNSVRSNEVRIQIQ